MFHHNARKSLLAGKAAGAAAIPASTACSKRQSRSVPREGSTFRILFTLDCFLLILAFLLFLGLRRILSRSTQVPALSWPAAARLEIQFQFTTTSPSSPKKRGF